MINLYQTLIYNRDNLPKMDIEPPRKSGLTPETTEAKISYTMQSFKRFSNFRSYPTFPWKTPYIL